MKKMKFAELYTLRADGLYMGYWRELDRDGYPTGKRHAVYDRDPERLYHKIQEKQKPDRKTFGVAAEEWETIHREEVSARTWMNYAPHVADLVDLYGNIPVEDISAFDISRDLLAAKAKGYSYGIVSSRRSIWSGILDFAVSQRYILFNPAASVKLPKGLKKGRRSAPPDDVIQTVIQCGNDMEFGFIPFFLLCTGVRRSEALHRLKSDIDTDAWELTIPKSKTQAGIRTVPIIVPLRAPLRRWMDAHPGPWLFPHIDYNGHTGTYMSDRNWERCWLTFCTEHGWIDENGSPLYGAHHLRHATATLLYESGVDMYTAQHILGHANVTTTLEIYTDLRAKHEKKNVGKFGTAISRLAKKTDKGSVRNR